MRLRNAQCSKAKFSILSIIVNDRYEKPMLLILRHEYIKYPGDTRQGDEVSNKHEKLFSMPMPHDVVENKLEGFGNCIMKYKLQNGLNLIG